MNLFLGLLLYSIVAYFIGSINAGQLLSRYKKVDLGETGSKNYGATNAGRTFGKQAFIMVFLFDFIKAFLIAIVFDELSRNLDYNGGDNIFKAVQDYISVALFFVLIGHLWPIWFRFRGGKGVATTFGLMLSINWVFAVIGGIVFLLVFFNYSKRVAISSVTAVFSIAVLGVLQPFLNDSWPVFDWSRTVQASVVLWLSFIFVTYRHQKNLSDFYNELKEKKNSKTKITNL